MHDNTISDAYVNNAYCMLLTNNNYLFINLLFNIRLFVEIIKNMLVVKCLQGSRMIRKRSVIMDRIESYFDPLFDYSNTKIDVNDKLKKQKIYYRQMSAGLRVGDLDNTPNLIY